MMNQLLNEQERGRLDQRIAEAEKITGAQFVLAVVRRCDSYSEIPWKAFAMGVSVAAVVLFVLDLVSSPWMTGWILWLVLTAVLSAGVVFALLSMGIAKVARLFLEKNRAEVEVRQYAESLFLDRQIFATRHRTGILLLVSMFERKIILLPDRGVQKHLDKENIEKVISSMTPLLATGEVAPALEKGLEVLEKILKGKFAVVSSTNELENEIIEEKGV